MDGYSKDDGHLNIVACHEGFMLPSQCNMALLWKKK